VSAPDGPVNQAGRPASGPSGGPGEGVGARVQAPFGRRLLTVAGMDTLGAYRVLRVADDGPAPQPGQFTMLAAVEGWGAGEDERPFLPRAFSVARWSGGEAHYLLEAVGPGTHRLCELRAGDGVWALGPLGVGFAPPDSGILGLGRKPGVAPVSPRRAILIGGGVGIAPLAIWQDALGESATVFLGFRDGARAEGAGLLRDAQVATDDGSVGHHGLVTDLLAAELDRDAHVTVYACGPAPMLEATRALCAARRVPAQLALESGMACGFGACFGCVVPVRGGGYARVCVDGPVFDAARLEHVEAHAGAPA
jgi:dihydroorotate dehydrogenase electron transfer subunit